MKPNPIRIVHMGRMDALGGVERLLQAFVDVPDAELSHVLMPTGRRIHSQLRPQDRSIPVRYTRYAAGFRLPRILRPAWRNRALRRLAPDVVSFWGYPTTDHDRMAFPERALLVYQEHGSAWDMATTERRKTFLSRVDRVVACSRAAKRMLELRWNCATPIRIVRNPLPAHVRPPENSRPKSLPENRPVRLGTVGRLVPYKAQALAVLTLAELRNRGADAELRLLGSGPTEKPLRHLVRKLNLRDVVRFLETTSDVSGFYAETDLLLHLPVREPLGLVAVEAEAMGLPVVATNVDGLPEAVGDGTSGRCVEPTLRRPDYLQLVGPAFDGTFPEAVYSPRNDALAEPLAVEPARAAEAVLELLASPAAYEAASQSAIEKARTDFPFPAYRQRLKQALLP